MDAQVRLASRLAEQQIKGLYRRHRVTEGPQAVRLRSDGRELVSFCSNDYLGLANHAEVKAAFIRGVERYGAGSGAAHLITGHSRAHQLLEQEICEFTGRDRALLFSTGYMANVGVLTALADRHDVIYQDKLNHASLIDGGLLTRAKMKRYAHCDTADLKRQLAQEKSEFGLLVTDGVFSMEGDIAPLAEIADMASTQGYLAMVDDAHGLGVLGDAGRGSVDAAALDQSQVPVYMATLGKALGTFGAFVAGPEEVVESLIQFARSYVYTTAPPPAVAEATRTSLKILQIDDQRRAKLRDNIRYFRDCAKQLEIDTGDYETAIQPLKMPDVDTAVAAQNRLQQEGYLLSAVRPPTVPEPCLRITLCSDHERNDIDGLLEALQSLLQQGGKTTE